MTRSSDWRAADRRSTCLHWTDDVLIALDGYLNRDRSWQRDGMWIDDEIQQFDIVRAAIAILPGQVSEDGRLQGIGRISLLRNRSTNESLPTVGPAANTETQSSYCP